MAATQTFLYLKNVSTTLSFDPITGRRFLGDILSGWMMNDQAGSEATTSQLINPLPTINLSVQSSAVLEDGTANLVYAFTRSGATASPLTVNYTVGGTASPGTDYTGVSTLSTTKTVTFDAGSPTAYVTINPVSDSTVESNESVVLTLASGSGYTIGSSVTVSGSIINEDSASGLSIFDRAGVNVAAKLFNDNQTVELGTVFSASKSGQITDLKYFRDSADANDTDTRAMRLWRVSDGALLASTSVTSTAGQSGWQNAKLNAPVTIVAGQQYVVSYQTADNYVATKDFFAPANEVSFDGIDNNGFSDSLGVLKAQQVDGSSGGSVFRYGSQMRIPNQTFEGTNYWVDATFIPATTAPAPASPPPTPVLLPTITLAVNRTLALEDGTSDLVYTFTRSGSTSSTLNVNYSVGGSASIGSDYTGIAGTGTTKVVAFAPGSSTATVVVNPTADTTVEADETVMLSLSAGSGYTFASSSSTAGTIANDDQQPMVLPTITLSGTPGSVAEDGASNLVYTFTRSGPTSSPLNISYNVGGTATSGIDYTGIATGTANKTLSFAAGSSTATVNLNPTADSTVESNETVSLSLAPGSSYSIGTPGSITGTIMNDDVALTGAGVTPAFGWLANESTVGLAPFGISGENLPVYTGPYKVPAGSFISGVRFTSNVDLSAGDITIEKSMFQPIQAARGLPLVTTTDFSQDSLPSAPGKVVIRDSEFDGTLLSDEIAAWATGFWGIADMQRNYIHHFGGGIALYNTGTQHDSLIEGNYITDMLGWGDPATTGNHSDTFTIRDFSDAARPDRKAIVRNNNFDNESPNVTGSFFIQANSRIANVQIEGNLLTGGGFNLALEQNRGGYSNIRAINNRFTPTGFGPVYTSGGEGWAAWQDNSIFNPAAQNFAGSAIL
jgi:hypothetical protein